MSRRVVDSALVPGCSAGWWLGDCSCGYGALAACSCCFGAGTLCCRSAPISVGSHSSI